MGQTEPSALRADHREALSLRESVLHFPTFAHFPPGNQSFWGPAWGTIAPFSTLPHGRQKAGSPST